MKRILYILLAVVMCFVMSVTVSAETTSFPMTINTGVIYFGNTTTINANFAPAIPSDDSIVLKANSDALIITKVALIVEGERYTHYIDKVTYDFTNYEDAACTQKVTSGGQYWQLGLFADAAYTGDFLVSSFSKIYSISLVTEAYAETDDEQIYNAMGVTTKVYPLDPIFTIVKNFANDTEITEIISQLAATAKDFTYTDKEIRFDYPFLFVTDRDNDGVISRTEVIRLSYSRLGEGRGIPGFEGLASQVAAFFNKQTNGKVTFVVTTAPATVVLEWYKGGIPSYYTGIFAPTTPIATDNLIGLFFDYESTGSLIASSKLEADGTITFDISQVLTDMGGNTLATLKSIYYGLIGGINYDGIPFKGIKVEQVILSYEDEDGEEVETTIPVITDDDEIEDEIDPDVDIIVIPEETTVATTTEADIVLEEDPAEEVITNAGKSVEGEDENPRTGVALAIIPSLIAGVAIFTTKKRK